MTRRRSNIPQKRVVFLGCEGESERAYAALLNGIARARAMPLAIVPYPLNPGAGDPLALVKRALQGLQHHQRHGRNFSVQAIFLDDDRCARDPNICKQASDLAQKNELRLIWQRPDHEAFLLRHLLGCQQLRPPVGTALARLQQEWPVYRKPMNAIGLATRIDHVGVSQACTVELDLRAFLSDLDWTHT